MEEQIQRSGQGMVRRLAVLLGSAALLLPLAEPVGQRTGFVARTLLAMAATAVATPAQAQTVETLVSNLEQADGGPGSFGFQHAQAFTTGGDAYTVTSVEIQIVDITGGENLSVEIWSESGGLPGAVLSGGALVMPNTLAAGVNEFTASGTGIALSANTTYFVVIKPAVSDSVSGNLRNTASDSEDSGGKTGWSIANNSRFRGNVDTDSWSSFSESKKIRLKGHATTPNNAPTVASQIEDQIATEGTAFSFTFPNTTFADEDGDTLTYSATQDDDSDLPTWLIFDADSRTFSGTPGAGDGGTITVRVTASDSTDTVHDDFQIKVGTDCPAPTFGTRRQIWTGTVTVENAPFIMEEYGYRVSEYGSISNRNFEIGSNSYVISRLSVADNSLLLRLSKLIDSALISNPRLTTEEKEELRLHVCNTTTYDLSDASESFGGVEVEYIWSSTLDWSSETARTVYLSLPANNAAAGTVPTISGTAAVSQTLTVDASGITDADGLPSSFTYQWYRENADGTGREAIAGATMSTYRLVTADAGKKILVQVEFVDLLGGEESVISAAYPATDTVGSAPTVSIRAVADQAMQSVLDARFEVTASEAPDTDLVVNLAFSRISGGAIVPDFVDATITIPANQTSAEKDFRVNGFDDDVVLTATVEAGTGYGIALAPANAATVEVVSDSEVTVRWVANTYTVEEGDDASPMLEFALPAGFPAPRGPSPRVNSTAASDSAVISRDYPFTLSSRVLQMPAANWNDDDNDTVYTGLLTVSAPTVEDTTREREERFFLDVAKGNGTQITVACPDEFREGPSCRTIITITDDDPNTPATGAPTISGIPAVSFTLTADVSGITDADGLPSSFTYQWLRENADGTMQETIPGATTSTYTLAEADEGKRVRVRVEFTDLLDSEESVESAALPARGTVVGPVGCPAPDLSGRRSVWTGTVTVGDPGSGVYGYSDDAGYGGIDSRTFTIGTDNHTVTRVDVTTSTGDLKFQVRDGGALPSSAQLHVCDMALNIEDATLVEFNAFNTYTWDLSLDWSAVSVRTMHLSLAANNAAGGAPTISGTATVNETLTADVSGITDTDGLPTDFTYQWLRENEDGTMEEAIPGATAATYDLVTADVDKKVKVRVSFTDQLSGMEEVTSDAYPSSGTVMGLPKITIEANRTTAPAFAGVINYTLTRQGDTAAALNDVRIILSGPAGHDWGSLTCPSNNACKVNFAAGSATATMEFDRRLTGGYFGIGFTGAGTVAGDLIASIEAVSGYDTSDTAKIGIVVPPAGQQVFQVGFTETDYEVMEGGGPYTITLEAVSNFTGVTLPIFTMGIAPITVPGTAGSPSDYGVLSIATQIGSSDCAVNSDDFLVCMVTVQLSIVDDSVAEPTENFRLQVQSAPGLASRAANFGSDVTVTLLDNDLGLLGVNVTSTPLQTGNTYGAREHIEFTARFNTPVEVSGVPTFTFDMGGTDVDATYFRGSGTDTLVFSYAVRGGGSGDEDTDGISWAANAFTGTINVAGTSDAALVVHSAQSALSSHKVDGPDSTNRADTATVTDITVTSTPRLKSSSSVTEPDTYGEGEDIEITVTFSEAVAVEGDPRFRFSLADSGETNNVDAVYDRGSGTTSLVFVYTVQASDSDDDGIFISQYGGSNRDTFQLANDDRIRVAANNVDVSFTHSEEGTQSGHKVDGTMNANICDAPDFGDRRQIWSGVVTVAAGFPNTGGGGLNGFIIASTAGNSDAGALDDRDFSIGSSTYTIDSIFVRDGGSLDGDLDFSLTSNLTAGERAALRLHVCDTPYNFSDALRRTATNTYYWSPNLDWSGVEERTLYLSLPPNSAPTVANAIADQTITVGTALNFAFPSTTFTDADGGPLTYSATLDDGNALPSWLTFDATNRSFSGTPGAGDGGAITVRVTASDGAATVYDDFRIRVGTTCAAPSLGSRRQLWTGTVTVGTWESEGAVISSYGYLAASVTGESNDVGALDDNDFTIDERTYTIDRVDEWRLAGSSDGTLHFGVTSTLTDEEKAVLRLHVCDSDTPYDFSNANNPAGEPNTYTWSPNLDWSGESTRTLYLSLPANNAASGLPTITSSDAATVGDILTAGEGTMADADGLPDTFPDDYTLQWVREEENGSNQQPILGQTSQTYTLTNADVGKKVGVQVSFTDRLGTMETVTSAAFPASGTVTPPLVTVTGPSSAVEEGSDLMFTFTLNKAASTNLTVNVAISETGNVVAGADEGLQTVAITAGQTQATLTVATADDDEDEANSEVTVAVTADSASPVTYAAGSPSAVMVTVEDNDLPRLRLDGPSQATYDEGETVRFGLTREGDLSSQLVVPVTVSGGGTMIEGTSPSSVTFGVGSDTAIVNIPTVDDDVDEENSDISVTVSANVADYRLVDTTNNPVNQQMANATIQDNDTRGVRVSGSPLVVNEGGTGAYEVVLNSAPTGEVTITLSPPDNEDVSVSPTTLTFTALNWNTPQPVSVTTTEDTDDVDDTATITHTVAGADYGDNNVTAESVMVTVSEMVLPTVTIATGASPVTEGTAAAFTLTRDDTTNGLTVNLTVTQNGEVFSAPAPSSGSVSFDAGVATAPFSVATDDDTIDEGEGTVTVEVAPDSAAPATYVLGTPATATVTVEDNDASPVVTLLLSDSMIAEADGVSEVRATLSNPSAEDTQVTVSIPAEVTGAVLLGGDPVLLIPAGATTSDNAVTLTSVDNPIEASEDLPVTVSGTAENALGVTQPEPVTLTILDDDDNTAPMVSITNVPPTSNAPFTVTITFDEVVNGFIVEDVTAVNATLSSFIESTTTPGRVWTVLVTPTADGVVTLNVAANMAMDAAGNGNTASSQVTSTYSVPTGSDPTPPPVSYSSPASLTVGTPITITPTTEDTDIARWSATGLPAGLVIDELTGVISGTPTTVSAAPSQVSVTVTDRSGNSTTVRLNFPAVTAQATRTAQQEAEVVLKEVVLPNLVQQLTAETTEVITSRLNTIASGSPLGAPPSLSLEDVVADTVAFFHGEREHLKNGSLEWRQVLSGREFVWPLSSLDLAQGEEGVSTQEHPFSTLAIWGGGNYSSYRNIIENTDVDGNGFSAAIGMDLQPTHQLTTGLVLTTSRWGLDYATDANDANDASDVNDATNASAEGTYGIGITMIHPYVSWSATEQLSLWATIGHGRGEVEYNPEEGNGTIRTDSLISWAGGVRFEVVPGMDPLTGQGAPFGLAFKADGATSSFLETSVQLARLAAEVSHAFAVENGLLTAALDLGWSIRSVADQDDRDGQQQAIAEKNHGGGAELAGNLNWRNADGRFSATLDTRVLLGGGHHREWGIGGHLRLTPSRRNGEGLSLTLQPSFGITGTRLAELWSLSGDGDLAINNNQPGARLDAELAYGFPLGDALLTPYTELAWEEAASTYGAGLRYGLSPSLELDLKGTRRSNAEGNPEHRFSLDVRSGL